MDVDVDVIGWVGVGLGETYGCIRCPRIEPGTS